MGEVMFNRGPHPLVPGTLDGIVLPGQGVEVDDPKAYGADQKGSAWTTDPEAVRALQKLRRYPRQKKETEGTQSPEVVDGDNSDPSQGDNQ